MTDPRSLTPAQIQAEDNPRSALAAKQERLIRRPDVEARTGLSRSTIYDWMKRGAFPQPVKLGTRLVAWRESDIAAWLASRETRGRAMTWDKNVTRRTMEEAGDYPGVQLQLLLQRLEMVLEALPAIAEAIHDMAHWHEAQAAALKAEAAPTLLQKYEIPPE